MAYKTFAIVPSDLVEFGNGQIMVGFYDRANVVKDHVKVFDAALEEIETIPIEYGFIRLFEQEDGIAISGIRLSPGQSDDVLYTDIIQPKFDTVVEKYNYNYQRLSRKSYFSEDSKTGYGGYNRFITEDGWVLVS